MLNGSGHAADGDVTASVRPPGYPFFMVSVAGEVQTDESGHLFAA